MIHPTAILGVDAFMYPRSKDGKRPRSGYQNHGYEVSPESDIWAHVIVVGGIQRPTEIRAGARLAHRAHIGHDCIIGENSIVGVGAILCGFVTVGARCTIGVGALVMPELIIASDCFVGAGVIVTDNLPANTKITVNGRRQNWEHLPWSG